MPERVGEATLPRQIHEVERVIGVRFLTSASGGFGTFDQGLVDNTYTMGLRLLAAARQHCGIPEGRLFLPSSDRLHSFRQKYKRTRTILAGALIRAAPVLKEIPQGVVTAPVLQKEIGLDDELFVELWGRVNPVYVTFKTSAETEHGRVYLGEDEAIRMREAADCMLRTVGSIALAAGAPEEAVRMQAAWHGFHYHSRRFRDKAGKMMPRNCLREEQTEILVKELSTIIPEGYLTPLEYANLRGINVGSVWAAIHRYKLPTHTYDMRDRTYTYLDGATMYRLNRLITTNVRAPEGWKTMERIVELTDATEHTVRKHLTGEFADVARSMRPREGEGIAVPHYPPEFVAHATRVIRPKGVKYGWRHLGELIESTGMGTTTLTNFFKRQNITYEEVRNENGYNSIAYIYEEFRRVKHKLPRRSIPLYGITLKVLAAYHNKTEAGMIAKIKIAAKKRPEGKFTTEPYLTGSKGTRVYYLKEELFRAGIDIPATPAFPAGERPYGPYGPPRGVGKPERLPRN